MGMPIPKRLFDTTGLADYVDGPKVNKKKMKGNAFVSRVATFLKMIFTNKSKDYKNR